MARWSGLLRRRGGLLTVSVAFRPGHQSLKPRCFQNLVLGQMRQGEVQRFMQKSFKFLPSFQTAINFDMAVQSAVHGNMGHARSLVAAQFPEGDSGHFTQINKEHSMKVTAFCAGHKREF